MTDENIENGIDDFVESNEYVESKPPDGFLVSYNPEINQYFLREFIAGKDSGWVENNEEWVQSFYICRVLAFQKTFTA